MGMNMHDRYYEPEDDDSVDLEEYVQDWIEYESREGGELDPKSSSYFLEAVGQLQLREEIESWDDCTDAEKEQVMAYLLDLGERIATESFYDGYWR